MARMFALLAAALSVVSAAPVADVAARQDSDPATVNFAPYAVVGCRMSENPYSGLQPSDYNVTSGHCITPSYSFTSYVEGANSLAENYCALSLFTGPDCTGTASAATLSTYEQCVPGGSQTWQSLELECGP